jgi:hypothetical protein
MDHTHGPLVCRGLSVFTIGKRKVGDFLSGIACKKGPGRRATLCGLGCPQPNPQRPCGGETERVMRLEA